MKSLLFLIVSFVLILGCKEESLFQKPDPLIPEDVYINIFYELELLSVYQDRRAPNEVIDSLEQEIFKEFNMDKETFLQNHEFYQTQILKQEIRVDSVIKRLEQQILYLNRVDTTKSQEELNE